MKPALSYSWTALTGRCTESSSHVIYCDPATNSAYCTGAAGGTLDMAGASFEKWKWECTDTSNCAGLAFGTYTTDTNNEG